MMSEPYYPDALPAPAPIANVEAEAALLGALLTKNELFDVAIEYLGAADFYEAVHGRIFSAIRDEVALGNRATPITLRPHFAHDTAMQDLGGPDYLARLTGSGAALLGVKDFARQIADLARTRELHEKASAVLAEIADTSKGVNPARHAAALEAIAFSATASKSERSELFTLSDSINRARERVVHIQTSGIPTGAVAADLPELTKAIGPLERKHFHVWAGRPGMGKSAVLCGAARSMGMGDLMVPAEERQRFGVGIISLEMSDIDLGTRFAADVALSLGHEIPHAKIRDAKLTDRDLEVLGWCAQQVESAPVELADVSGITMARVVSLARQMKRSIEAKGYTFDVLFIDYLQLIQADARYAGNRVQEVSEISMACKRLAKELNCAVVALSQLSRAVEQREIKTPMLSDLRESGSIEQDADTVMFLFREWYYLKDREPDQQAKPREWEAWNIAMRATENVIEFIVPKRRGGAAGRASATWIPAFSAVRAKDYYSANPGSLYQ